LTSGPERSLRILVVDDDPDTAESFGLLLTSWGYSVRSAMSGHAALHAAETFNADVAFVDLAMPLMDGFEIVRRLRKLPSGEAVYVIALTGMTRELDRTAAYAAGCDRYIVKPAEPVRLRAILHEIAETRTA
jgi:CheY-like chemotaxis protein